MGKLNSFLVNKILKITLDELVRPLGEMQELLSEAEDLYFELKNGALRSVERLFWHKRVLAQLRFYFSKVRYV